MAQKVKAAGDAAAAEADPTPEKIQAAKDAAAAAAANPTNDEKIAFFRDQVLDELEIAHYLSEGTVYHN